MTKTSLLFVLKYQFFIFASTMPQSQVVTAAVASTSCSWDLAGPTA